MVRPRFNPGNDRVFVILAAGNLATTQAIVSRIEQDMEEADTQSLITCKKMVEAARYISQVSREEVEQARHQEPLIRLRRYLTELGVWDETREEELLADCQKQVDEAVETYLNTPVQAAGAMFDFMFEELPPALAEQRENALHYEPRGGDH